jgi:glycosyltransferase involved in cell wall biosynthesis
MVRSERTEKRSSLRILVLYSQTVLWSMGEGKGAVSFTRTLETLAARGHQVRLSLPAEPGAAASMEIYRGFYLHRAPAPGSFIPRASLPLPRRLWERARRWRAYQKWSVNAALEVAERMPPDLVVALGAFEAPAAYETAQILGVPNATRLFGVWTPHRDRLRQLANFPERVALRTPASFLLITNDGSEGDRLARAFHVPEDRSIFLRNGLDTERFSPGPGSSQIRARLGLSPDQPMIMTVTRLAHEKKIERAIDAMPELVKRVPNAVLVLVGDGELREALVAHARALGVGEQVRFPGAVVQSELADWYRTSDLVLSLLDRTNASNPVFEAMGCGRPVIALDTGATGEVVRDGETGVLVSKDDLSRLGAVIADLLERPDLRARMGAEAVTRIRGMMVSPEDRLAYEMDLFEAAARRLPLPRWLTR